MRIETGQPEGHETPLPYDPGASPAVAPPVPASGSGTAQGGVMPATAMFAEQQRQGEAAAAAAQAFGMAAEHGRRDHYGRDILPQGSSYGDTMTLPPSPLDPGVGSTGITSPSGAFYDPPRSGAPETYA